METKDIHSNIQELNKTLKYDPVTLLGIRVVSAFVNGNHIYRIYQDGEHKADLLTLTETKVTIEVLKNENRSL